MVGEHFVDSAAVPGYSYGYAPAAAGEGLPRRDTDTMI